MLQSEDWETEEKGRKKKGRKEKGRKKKERKEKGRRPSASVIMIIYITKNWVRWKEKCGNVDYKYLNSQKLESDSQFTIVHDDCDITMANSNLNIASSQSHGTKDLGKKSTMCEREF